ncbi:unnamed protein product [Gordionus sp. m RMFG-2023]|uniref:uncharacterized protein LOC135925901 n=1 Tax=Gordionus sp. m RMFG-2023 TaxID=3053472 RepID=UPI0030DE19E6
MHNSIVQKIIICFLVNFYQFGYSYVPRDNHQSHSHPNKQKNTKSDIERYKTLVGVKNGPIDVVALLELFYDSTTDYQCALSISVGSLYQLERNNPIGPSGAGFGLASYISVARLDLRLNSATILNDIFVRLMPIYDKPVNDINLEKALNLAKIEFEKSGRCHSIKQIWIYLSETSIGNPEDLAKTLREMGIEIFVFAIGPRVNRKQIEAIASSRDHIFWYPSYCVARQSLVEFINKKFL